MPPTLATLKTKLNEMLEYFDKTKRCIYVDYPLHTNIGDLLINTGCEQFFRENEVNIWRRYSYYDFPKKVPDITDDDVFLLHGGGNLGDLYFDFQRLRESILEQYPRNRVIFLPQTVHFSSDSMAAASIDRMNRHNNLHVFARDHRSLAYLQQFGLRSVSAMPDTAHALAGTLHPTVGVESKGTMRLLRLDVEASSVPERLSVYQGDTYDWRSGVFNKAHMVTYYGVVKFVKGVAKYGPPVDLHALWYWERDLLIDAGIKTFSKYENVLTNRLHAMILGLLLRREVIAFDNSYGKLSTYHDSWLKGIEGLKFNYEEAN